MTLQLLVASFFRYYGLNHVAVMTSVIHGGRLNDAASAFNIPRPQWLDLSTGINPQSYPLANMPIENWQRLPESDDGLEGIAAGYYQCQTLMMTPGSQWSIERLPIWLQRLGNSKNTVLLPALGYQEHFVAWQRAGFNCQLYRATPSPQQLKDCSALVVINPNNPSGVRIEKSQLLQWQHQLNQQQGWLIVDEAFADVKPEWSLSAEVGSPGLVVLRSLGKFFGLAGVRVGSLLAWPQLLRLAEADLGPWALTTPSRWAAKQALLDRVWQQQMQQQLPLQAERLNNLLQSNFSIRAYGCELFQTVWLDRADKVYRLLAQQGILVRLLDEYSSPGLRFGLPPNTEQNWQRLAAALSDISADI